VAGELFVEGVKVNNEQLKRMIMKKLIVNVCAVVVLGTLGVGAGEPGKEAGIPKPAPSSAEFERLKSLVGTWQGKVDMGQGPVDMTAKYRLLAGGTVLEERVFEGTPHEMITMFYDKNGKLALTHYCVMGNRPGMVLKSADAKSIQFAFDESCGINPKKESHMHALSLSFDDANTITATCEAFMDGKEMEKKPTVLKRVSLAAKAN
jgi:hypothetical protein